MDWQPAWSDTCTCGRTFTSTHGYTNHQRNCSKTKKRLSSTLAKAREVRDAKKRRITGAAEPEATGTCIAEEVAQPKVTGPCVVEQALQPKAAGPHVVEEAAQPEASGSRITKEVAQAEAHRCSSHLAAAQLPSNDTPLPGIQQQVGFLALELTSKFHYSFLFLLCLSGGRG